MEDALPLASLRLSHSQGQKRNGNRCFMSSLIRSSLQIWTEVNTKTNKYVITRTRCAFDASAGKRHTSQSEFDISYVTKLPRVDIVFADEDMEPDLIDASVNASAKGIVIAGVGNGDMNKVSVEAAGRAVKKGVVVVRSSRVATGMVDRNVEVNDDELRFIASDELNPQKSRILLSLALLKPESSSQIRQLFRTY
jgi:L-asparaginase/Glu-tRNA(Gln) amidotransferase subunit D